MVYYPGKLEKIKITPEFKELLFEVELDKDILEIEGLYFYDTDLLYKSTAPLYKYDPIGKAYSRQKYNGCPLFYLVGTNYLVYDITQKGETIRLTSYQSKPTEINPKYIILSEEEKIFKDLVEKSVESYKELSNKQSEFIDKELEEIVDCYDIKYKSKNIKITVCDIMLRFLIKVGFDDAKYELQNDRVIFKFK